MHRFTQRILVVAAAALVPVGLVSCSDATDPAAETGTLRVNLVDAPARMEGVESLEVVFEQVLVHRSEDAESGDGGWFTVLADTIPAAERTFDLLELVNGVWATLGEVELETGVYTQIRIMFASATVTVDGVEHDVFIPSGDRTGLKLTGSFTVDPDAITTLTADFDVHRSLHEAPPGSDDYILRPTIRIVQDVLSGTISGTVMPLDIDAAVFALAPSAGDTISSTMVDTATGGYVIPALLEGVYDVTASASGYRDSTRTGITVVAGHDTPDVIFVLEPADD